MVPFPVLSARLLIFIIGLLFRSVVIHSRQLPLSGLSDRPSLALLLQLYLVEQLTSGEFRKFLRNHIVVIDQNELGDEAHLILFVTSAKTHTLPSPSEGQLFFCPKEIARFF
jgi:hypothetical protein